MNPSTDIILHNFLPADNPQRALLHNAVHARPSQRIRLHALVVCVAVLNADVTLEQECEHLCHLPDQEALIVEHLQRNFLRLRLQGYTLRWEHHTEFTRYTLMHHLPEGHNTT